ncbi:MAG TPA: hypothetical protein VLS91_03760 [Acidimicrobiales bacterium]|nr:hypothetical protein [Acidimicrobiales bacterium]
MVAAVLLVGVAVPSVVSQASSTTTTTTTSATTTSSPPTSTTTTTTTVPGTSSPSTRAGSLPLYQFVASGSGQLPWSAQALTSSINSSTMLGGPRAVTSPTEGVVAYRTASNHVALYTQSTTGATQWSDLTPGINAEAPAGDPVPFFDPWGNVDVLYITATGNLELLTPNDPVSAFWLHAHRDVSWRPLVATSLSALMGVSVATGVAGVAVSGASAIVAVRTVANSIVTMTLTWAPSDPIPAVFSPPTNLSAITHTGAATSDPVVLSAAVPAIATTTNAGHLELYVLSPTSGTWSAQDLSRATGSARVTGPLATTSTPYNLYVAALSPNGNVILFATPLITLGVPTTTTTLPNTTTTVATPTSTASPAAATTTSTTTTTTLAPSPWSVVNVTSSTPGSPPLSGALFLTATTTQVAIAGAAANWGDLFVLTSPNGYNSWTDTDVSVTAGNAARTVATSVTGLAMPTGVELFAGGINSPPPQGVGVYAIPSAKWTQAVLDGWPILSETGGLGTMGSPWVGWTGSASLATSPDYLMGRSIYNGHKRVTWLSYWTVSGPLKGETIAASTYYTHGFAAGAWVATQIDQYAGLGEGLKPDWVIFDPEGYPDAHSGLDAPGGSSATTMSLYATYWTAMLSGWVKGIASVDPSLKAGVYASQSEYRNYKLANQPMPVFIALAFGGGGPIPVAGASGSNVRGFIAFNGTCSPTSALAAQEQTLANPPWGGQFNTLQFNAGVYCPPAAF